MFSSVMPWLPLAAYPVYVLMMALVLKICGVERGDIAKWALRQADRQRLTDLIRAARGLAAPEAGGPRPAPGPPEP
ncbi:hypothetical protein Daura_05890 [Dactylosporangium aurantiacum]|uniref:Uncharacterized protein n=1 Tax=Dactylosporangium aurantiacum TaxID=35754 RepID=A0A9Q9IKX2_9ACTN|nr:hypothetical protein [Dactylosporangium aurantiacum]MDG6104700.1 hypothetical protein [Dactylosporangium aurantiacum]UWZ55732.1 hypothetical protein Daura_05890 [Dactylosporangium aurantiacum]